MNLQFTPHDIEQFQQAAASVGMTAPETEAVGKEGMASLLIKLSKQDLARCNRAAVFCGLSLHQWAWDSVMASLECDEDDMSPEAAQDPAKFAQCRQTDVGKERPGWEFRESLPDPIAQGF